MKKPGIREIAKLANVSPGTVDRALHGRKGITGETRRRILAIAESLGYTPDLAARALSVGRAPVHIGVSIPREIHHYFDRLLAGIRSEANRFERLGVKLFYSPTERLGRDDVQKASELLAQQPDALILTPGNPCALAPLIDEAESRGIRVVCVDTDAPASKRSSAVCINPVVCGRLAAELMAGFLPQGSDAVVVTGMLDVEDHAKKTEGFTALYAEVGGGDVQLIEAHEDEDEAFQKCFALLSGSNSVAGIYVNTVNSLPVCRAIGAAGLAGRIKVITTDLFAGMVPFFERGVIAASIHGRPFAQGEIAVRLILDHLLNGRQLPKERLLMPQVVMRSNLHYFPEISGSTAEQPAPVFVEAIEL
ncbi:MAG: substrate-binding domain-containing protein [Bryobacterales bacterium]|nr:substrate-binding domain-containing protein [Bryobacterales bacterium]MEB2364146.1 substrate-binding domain-containing protein [Bryobacterales bacterium]